MLHITPDRIAQLAPRVRVEIATNFAAALEASMPRFGITSPLDRQHFMAQACHESGGFLHLEESFNYRDPARLDRFFSAVRGEDDARALIAAGPVAIANRVYAGRNGNGNEASGDGWKYRGRGLFQLTGRTNYASAAKALGKPYLDRPEMVTQAEGAVLTALWFWKAKGCSAPAQVDDVEGVTRIINGTALAGLQDRRELTAQAKRIFT